ncbi:TPA: hypothetical protein ACN7KQ_001185 [Klebsiella pneumoniae]
MKTQKVGLKLAFILIFYCVLILIGVALLSCLCAAYLAFLKHGRFIFGWEDDVIYSIKAGIAAGIPTGIGVWFMSWMKTRKQT